MKSRIGGEFEFVREKLNIVYSLRNHKDQARITGQIFPAEKFLKYIFALCRLPAKKTKKKDMRINKFVMKSFSNNSFEIDNKL